MLGLWAILTLIGVLYAVWQGFGGPAFAATLTSFALLFLVMLLFAARRAETVPQPLVGLLDVPLALALSGRAARVRDDYPSVPERGSCGVCAPAAPGRYRLLHRLGPQLELFHPRQLPRVCPDCHPPGHRHAF